MFSSSLLSLTLLLSILFSSSPPSTNFANFILYLALHFLQKLSFLLSSSLAPATCSSCQLVQLLSFLSLHSPALHLLLELFSISDFLPLSSPLSSYSVVQLLFRFPLSFLMLHVLTPPISSAIFSSSTQCLLCP